ncbi:hypothetical protein KGF57_002791 [Candida theae]|uniref:tRNA dimethylallyltransferase n=1 Tax=Candida theae TaxID=1198502 RepID=A0AAD5BE59_9ASCO|nr:uncharacterized protein KGF57_002791 [Candida theae]KAI5957983.1 hypothetical protein KGF57_002791 [Candida theae]
MISRLFRYLTAQMSTLPTKKPIISIVGTTGVGKSQFSIELAKKINGEVINADSMQVYKGVDVIANKHPMQERDGIPHHIMDHVDWSEEYFIHRFNKEAHHAIEDIHLRGKVPIIVGGTHYYLQSLLFNNKTLEKKKERELTEAELGLLDGPTDILFQELKRIDPLVAEKFHPQDHRKLRRAVEIWYTTGQKPSDLYIEQKLDELEKSSLKYNTLVFWLYSEPQVLQDRLDKRVDKMMEIGAREEIDELYRYYAQNNGDSTSGIFQIIGFKEFLPWLENKKQNPEAFANGIDRMKIRTRQYAKYQVKWIQKTLQLELKKESKFNYVNGGRLFLLDATDLTHWKTNVCERAASKKDFQFSFMRATSSSIQKRQSSNPLNSALSTSSSSGTASSVKKKFEHSRQLSHSYRTRKVGSYQNTSKDTKITSNATGFEFLNDSPTKSKPQVIVNEKLSSSPRRHITQPIPGSSDVFQRLYTSKPKSNGMKPHANIPKPSNAEKVQTLAELYSILHRKDPMLFENTHYEAASDSMQTPLDVNTIALNSLNIYERGEILRKESLYYVPTTNERNINLKSYGNNFGFDDKEGNYIVIPNEHINYRFQILHSIGNGSFGNVILAKDHKFKRNNVVAIKIINNNFNSSIQSVNEIKMLKHMKGNQHENVLEFYEHFNFRSHICIVTEVLSLNLYSVLEITQFRGFSPDLVKQFAKQILNGLAYLHSLKIIHCDVKPENVMIKLPPHTQGKSIVVKLIDFGSSCFDDKMSFTYIQSRYYRAPEIILGANYDNKIDIWSLGCLMAELFTGSPLLAGKNEIDQIGLMLEIFGAPRSSTILKMRAKLTRSLLQSSKDMNLSLHRPNERQIKKTLLYKVFDLNGKINMSILNHYKSATNSTKKQFKLNSKNLEVCLGTGSSGLTSSKLFLSFLRRAFIWDPNDRASVSELLQDEFLK